MRVFRGWQMGCVLFCVLRASAARAGGARLRSGQQQLASSSSFCAARVSARVAAPARRACVRCVAAAMAAPIESHLHTHPDNPVGARRDTLARMCTATRAACCTRTHAHCVRARNLRVLHTRALAGRVRKLTLTLTRNAFRVQCFSTSPSAAWRRVA
jgi:hypothetical protein